MSISRGFLDVNIKSIWTVRIDSAANFSSEMIFRIFVGMWVRQKRKKSRKRMLSRALNMRQVPAVSSGQLTGLPRAPKIDK